MSDTFKFETFVDARSNIFNEYLSSVIAKLSQENKEYKVVQDEIRNLYPKYSAVFRVFDSEQAAVLTEEECVALIEIMELRNQLTYMELQVIYFHGCYDGAGYLKKADIL